MGEPLAEARQEVVNARQAAASELDELGDSFRAAIDIPAKIRRNPLKTAGLAGGAAFLALGGPKRMLKGVERRLFPARADRIKSLLPEDVARAVDRLGEDAEGVRSHLERDFKAFLDKRHPSEQPNARRSLWRTYDIMLGSIGSLAARELAKRLFEAPTDRPRDRGSRPPEDAGA
jgi:hypothetical protein